MIRRLLELLFGRRTSRDGCSGERRVPADIGQSTRGHMTALREWLSDREWEELLLLGRGEQELRGLREDLRALTRREGAIATAASTAREEIDAYLSEPDGPLARTLKLYPSPGQGAVRETARHCGKQARHLAEIATDLLDAARAVDQGYRQIERLRGCYAAELSNVWELMGGNTLAHRAAGLHTRDGARRFVDSLAETEASLSRQQRSLETALVTLREAALDCRLEWPDGAPAKGGLEQQVAHLAAALRRHALEHAERAAERTVAAADAQLHHLGTTRSDDFLRPPTARSILPRNPVLRRWTELHAVRLRLRDSTAASGGTRGKRKKRQGGRW